MEEVFLLLGSNTGNSLQILSRACKEIENRVGKITAASSVYLTEPWGMTEQPPFCNQALQVQTSLAPSELLKCILQIEKEQGRTREAKYGPRTLDVDILYFGNEIVVKKDLKIPHPEIHNRNFVLVPLAEVAPEFKHPVFNITTREMLNRCKDPLKVEKMNTRQQPDAE